MNASNSVPPVIFDDDEFEIAIVTASRSEFVKEWLSKCLDGIKHRNIHLSIYDSSSDDRTEKVASETALSYCYEIDYHHVDEKTTIGLKSLIPIRESHCRYLWVSGDSRYHDMELLDKSVFSAIKKDDVDYIALHIDNNDENDGKKYCDRSELLKECFLSMTCIGLSVYRVEMFRRFFCDKDKVKECEKKYDANYAFAWIGYFLEAYALYGKCAQFFCVPILDILTEKKVQSWYSRFYKCWGEDLYDLMNGVSGMYEGTDRVLRQTWGYMNIDMAYHTYNTKKKCDLTPKLFEDYLKKGIWEKATDNIDMYREFAYAEDEDIEKVRDKWLGLEKQRFEEKYGKILKKLAPTIKGGDVCIYGAGVGGNILVKILESSDINIKCIYDKKAAEIKKMGEYDVKRPEEAGKDDLILVSFMYYVAIKKHLMDIGIKKANILYLKELMYADL